MLIRNRLDEFETTPDDPRARSGLRRAATAAVALILATAAVSLTVVSLRQPRLADRGARAEAENGLIAFAEGIDSDISGVTPDGSGVTTLVDRHGNEDDAGLEMAWSPDGARLAFTDLRPDGFRSLYVVEASGEPRVDLSAGLLEADSPAWSPDGSGLAFTGIDSATGYEIWVVNADGSGLRRITDRPDNGVDGAYMPAWSPDGTRLAFSMNRYDHASQTESSGIAVVPAGGGDPVILTWSPHVDQTPAWSPDGANIAFVRHEAGLATAYVVAASRPAEPTRLSSAELTAISTPTWSPDSRHVWFSARLPDGTLGIHVASVDGSDRVLLEDAAGPVWSPDGEWIAFVRTDEESGLGSVWVMRPDGTDLREVSGGLNLAGGLAWQAVASAGDSTESEPSPSPAYLAAGERWAPPTYREGDHVVMPVTFPDGTTAEILYPPGLALHELSVYPDTFADGPRPCGWAVGATRYDPRLGWVAGDEPIAEHVRPDGTTVEAWRGTRNHGGTFLVYRFGSWSVLVPCDWQDAVDRETLATWAENVHGRETDDGLLVLESMPPVELNPFDDRYGPTIRLSSEDIVIDLTVSPEACSWPDAADTVPGADDVVQWCVQPQGGIWLYAYAFDVRAEGLLQDLVEGLVVRNVRPPG